MDEVERQCGVVVVGVGWGQAPALHFLPRLSVVNSRFGKFGEQSAKLVGVPIFIAVAHAGYPRHASVGRVNGVVGQCGAIVIGVASRCRGLFTLTSILSHRGRGGGAGTDRVHR